MEWGRRTAVEAVVDRLRGVAPPTRRRLLAAGAVVLALAVVLGLLLRGEDRSAAASGSVGVGPLPTAADGAGATGYGTPATMAGLRKPDGLHFGVSTPGSPNEPETENVSASAYRLPTVQEYFVNWDEEFSADRVTSSYHLGAVPLLTWQPSAGKDQGDDQPAYALRRIASGAHDGYVRRFADAVREVRQPVVIRFAHEMNADWYPWAEQRSGNRQGDYVAAWRHVHDVFASRGVTNVLWFWCPNIHRGTDKHELARYFPGDQYVDWIGMDGYSESEKRADEVFDETYADLVSLSQKPIFIGETGVRPNVNKALWTVDFFRWIKAHPRVVGFSWFQHSDEEGGRYDWRFTTSPGSVKAFQDGLADQRLVPWPMR
ncbi:glycoside hydrolase family 26 protein [Kitasatospora arboriphila]